VLVGHSFGSYIANFASQSADLGAHDAVYISPF
jgi:alpha/beta superfamily hydrolase